MFKQSLPGIKAIVFLPCKLLPPNIVEKFLAGVPIGVFSTSTPIEYYGNASCEAESEYTGGTYYESTTLQFTTTDKIRQMQQLAFVVTDVNNHTYVIGCKEAPYPVVDITTNIDKDNNISHVKVSFSRKKSLIPCVV